MLAGDMCDLFVAVLFAFQGSGNPASHSELLWQYRNLGKAFYENPTTPREAVEQFHKALSLAPNSTRERLNYGLALLRAGDTGPGVAELEKVQGQDPSLPHTWFNLGVVFKKEGDYRRAIEQFRHMAQLVPDEPVTHYNLGLLYRLGGDNQAALQEYANRRAPRCELRRPAFPDFRCLARGRERC
jgi:Flp pilus assembly protein TadD